MECKTLQIVGVNFVENTFGGAIQHYYYVMTNTVLGHHSSGQFRVSEVSKSGIMVVNRRSLFISKTQKVTEKFPFVISVYKF